VNQFQQELENGGNKSLIAVGNFYRQKSAPKFLSVLKDFLEVQKKYLLYFYNNYEKIHKKQQPQIYTYEKFYLQYTRSTERYDQATDLESKAINHILQEYPKTKKLFLIRKGTAIFTID
jgi:hypothetical protein